MAGGRNNLDMANLATGGYARGHFLIYKGSITYLLLIYELTNLLISSKERL